MNGTTFGGEESDSSCSIEGEYVEMEPKPSRSQKIPVRFGATGALSFSENGSNDSLQSLFSDDSTDEYVPAENPKRKIVHTVHQMTKKSKINDDNFLPKFSWNENYDVEFDQLNKSVDEQLSIHEDFIREIDVNGRNAEQKLSTVNSSVADVDHDQQKENTPTIEANKSDANFSMDRQLLIEILARVKTIEDSIMKTGSLANVPVHVNSVKPFNEFQTFLKSNRLPLKNIEDMNAFQENLDDAEFRKVAVS